MVDIKVFAENLEPQAMDQIDTLATCSAFDGAKIRIMPDAHAGAGCVIGFTANLGDKVIPNLVGVDIGCGMGFCKLNEPITDFKRLDRIIRKLIPTGFKVHDYITFPIEQMGLRAFDKLCNVERLGYSIGTLGGGNHFIEVDEDEEGNQWLVVHTGSRNLGLQIAKIYQHMAEEECGENVPHDLEYLEGESAQDYLHDMRLCQQWAAHNREIILNRILFNMDIAAGDRMHTVHNYIADDNVIRKGAISAKEGELVLIPFNMRDGSILAVGKGNPDWNESAPHGAGRLMSRAMAKKTLDVEDFKRQMEGIYTTSVGKGTLDEAPDAYKSMGDILKLIDPTVDVVHRLKPVYNLKAS